MADGTYLWTVGSETEADAKRFQGSEEVIAVPIPEGFDYECVGGWFYRSEAWGVVVDTFEYGVALSHVVHFRDYQTYANNAPHGPGNVQMLVRRDGSRWFGGWRQNRLTRGLAIYGGASADYLVAFHRSYRGTDHEQFSLLKRNAAALAR